MQNVIIIGGGLAGLSAATMLCEHGVGVRLYETNGYCGGRAASYFDRNHQKFIDHGQHLLMGAYRETGQFFKRLGVFHKIFIQDRLQISLLHPDHGLSVLQSSDWPAPFHLFSGLMKLKHLSIVDKLSMGFPGLFCKLINPDGYYRLDTWTVRRLNQILCQTRRSQDEFWNLLCSSALNESAESASAYLFCKVLREAFFSAADSSRIWLPTTSLTELYVNAALDYIKARGGEIRLRHGMNRIDFGMNDQIHLFSHDLEEVTAGPVISAVPPYALRKMLADSDYRQHFSFLSAFENSCIITTHLWMKKPLFKDAFIGLINSPIEWIFNKHDSGRNEMESGHHYAIVISAANNYLRLTVHEIFQLVFKEIRRFFPEANPADLLDWKVIKFKRATFKQKAGMQAYRPTGQTDIPNFYLAGDWTNTGLPATIEGAVLSGHRAAELILKKKCN